MKNYCFALLLISSLLVSCSINKKIAVVETGEINSSSIEMISEENLKENDTYVYYEKDGEVITPSNQIEFSLIQKEKIKKQRIEIPRNKNKYAFANVNKYFYKYKPLNTLVNVIAVPGAVFTFGASLGLIRSPHRRYVYSSDKCDSYDCLDKTYNKKILLETNIYCKNDNIFEPITLIENLPESITMTNYKIKIRKGKRRIEDVNYEEKTINGKTYHKFMVTPKNGKFEKKNKVWIIIDIAITPSNENLLNVSSR